MSGTELVRSDPGTGSGALQQELPRAVSLARYLWVSELARGRDVLDAGCGLGEGTRLLAEAGAAHVLGLDSAATLIEASANADHPAVELRQGDVTALKLEQESFELVICFGVLDHLAQPQHAVGELARVLAPRGILAVSAVDDGVEEIVRRLFPHVCRYEQDAWLASAVVPADGNDGVNGAGPMRVRPFADGQRFRPACVLVASAAPLPPLSAAAALASPEGLEALVERLEQRERELRDRARELAAAEAGQAERAELQRRLAEAEERLGRTVELEGEIRLLRVEVDRARRLHAGVTSTQSWRYTAPLRAAKRQLRRLASERYPR